MKNVCIIISIILLISVFALVFLVRDNVVNFNINSISSLNIIIYSAIIVICSFASGFVFNQGRIEEFKNNSTKQLRKAEKANIDTKESLDKIDRLNAKIETLEIALKEALKRKEGN